MESEAPKPELSKIKSAINEIAEPYDLGIYLEVPTDKLDKFEINYPKDVNRQMTEVIKHWLRNNTDDQCSWEALANAVEKMGKYGNLVKELRKQHSISASQNEVMKSKSVGKTAAKARTSAKLSDRPEPQELKKYVWKHVGEKWEELAILLGLDEDKESAKKLEDIKEKRKDKASMAAIDVLMLWQGCDQAEPSWERLIDALETADLIDAVKSIKGYLEDNEDTDNQQSPPAPSAAGNHPTTKGSQASNNAQQPKTKEYTVQMKELPGQAVHNYQHELAAPGIEGKNYIVGTPTNSEKTLVAALVIADHLEKNKQQKWSPREAVEVKTRPQADQQRERLAEFIPSAVVECRTGNRGDIKERQQQLHIKDALPHSEITVCTAGKLLNEFKKEMFQEAFMRSYPAQNVELRCKKCKTTACRGSDIYLLDNTGHHVVPGGVLDYELMEHATPGKIIGCGKLMIEKRYKIHCTVCNASWGGLGTWPSKEKYPILKCNSFNFYVDGRRVSVRKWKNKPFKTSPLSEWIAETKHCKKSLFTLLGKL